jgi:ATP-dependent Clp protease ATP-binding subunit ClpX
MIKVNTRNILFIVGGAFVGLDKIVERAITKEHSGIGFGADVRPKGKRTLVELMDRLEPDHLVSFGMIPELIGRLPVWTSLSELTEEELVLVLTEPKNSLVKQYKGMFKIDGVALDFDADALNAVAQIARKRKVGGRGLRNVLEHCLLKTQFSLPDLRKDGAERIVVTRDAITGSMPPTVVYAPPPAPETA